MSEGNEDSVLQELRQRVLAKRSAEDKPTYKNDTFAKAAAMAEKANEIEQQRRIEYLKEQEEQEEPQEIIVDLRGFHVVRQDVAHIVFENGTGQRLTLRNWKGRLVLDQGIWKTAIKED